MAEALACGGDVAPTVEVIVVDDGSSDETGRLADSLAQADPRVRVIHHAVNQGYGAALRSGFAEARGTWVFYTDGDGQLNLDDLRGLPDLLATCDVVVGYRVARQDPLARRWMGAGWTWLVNRAFGLSLRDADCAFKIFPREFLHSAGLKSTGALISAELVARADRSGLVIRQMAVDHRPRVSGRPTGAHPRVILRAFRELWALRGEIERSARVPRGSGASRSPRTSGNGRLP